MFKFDSLIELFAINHDSICEVYGFKINLFIPLNQFKHFSLRQFI